MAVQDRQWNGEQRQYGTGQNRSAISNHYDDEVWSKKTPGWGLLLKLHVRAKTEHYRDNGN